MWCGHILSSHHASCHLLPQVAAYNIYNQRVRKLYMLIAGGEILGNELSTYTFGQLGVCICQKQTVRHLKVNRQHILFTILVFVYVVHHELAARLASVSVKTTMTNKLSTYTNTQKAICICHKARLPPATCQF